MKKRYVFLILSSFSIFFVALKKMMQVFEFRTDENVFSVIKAKNEFMENFLIYVGLFLILISIIGITVIMYNPYPKEKNKESNLSVSNSNLKKSNQRFEDLYS